MFNIQKYIFIIYIFFTTNLFANNYFPIKKNIIWEYEVKSFKTGETIINKVESFGDGKLKQTIGDTGATTIFNYKVMSREVILGSAKNNIFNTVNIIDETILKVPEGNKIIKWSKKNLEDSVLSIDYTAKILKTYSIENRTYTNVVLVTKKEESMFFKNKMTTIIRNYYGLNYGLIKSEMIINNKKTTSDILINIEIPSINEKLNLE